MGQGLGWGSFGLWKWPVVWFQGQHSIKTWERVLNPCSPNCGALNYGEPGASSGCLLLACLDSSAWWETPRGPHTPQDWTLSRSTLNPCWVEMKEKIACNWQLPSWGLSSWEVSAWTLWSSRQTVKPLPEDRFGAPRLGRWLLWTGAAR